MPKVKEISHFFDDASSTPVQQETKDVMTFGNYTDDSELMSCQLAQRDIDHVACDSIRETTVSSENDCSQKDCSEKTAPKRLLPIFFLKNKE